MTEELALNYIGLVKNITSKYNFRSDYDDLFQAGMVGTTNSITKV